MNRRKRSRVNPEGYSDKYDNSPRYSIDYFGPSPLNQEQVDRYAAQMSLYADMFEQKRPLPINHQDDGWRDIGTVAHEQAAEIWTKER